MPHHSSRAAGLVAILAMLVLAPAASAAVPATSPGVAPAKERAYGKHCGPKTGKAARSKTRARSRARAKCLDAMAKLDRNGSLSPAKACRALSRKRAKGERKSAYARCVSEGAKLLKAKKRAGSGSSDSVSADERPVADDADPPDGGDAVDDLASTPADELLPEDFLSGDELDPDF